MAPIVATDAGSVEGREKNGLLLFAGIPYAAPPTGTRRFRPPEPMEPWSGTRDATRFGLPAWQAGGGTGALLSMAGGAYNEDCLTLNVMTPASDDAGRPVLFWIHGGGFTGGTGATPWYDGHAFAGRHDCVVVTINYRLGALGFLHLADLGGEPYRSSGLNGILDQVAALRWVKANIAAFGGDPGNVTIFGESAGGMSVGTLLGMPEAQGLFHKAIAQSGASHFVLEAVDATQRAEAFLRHAGCASLDDLLALTPEQVITAQEALGAEVRSGAGMDGLRAAGAKLGLPFQPVLDGHHLTTSPLSTIEGGSAATVPLMLGTTANEWNLFALLAGSPTNEEAAIRRLDRIFDGHGRSAFDVYQAGRPGASATEVYDAIFTDLVFRIPSIRLAETHAAAAAPDIRTWSYLFTHESTAFDGRLGACHAIEIPFVFDTLGKAGVDFLLGHDGPPDLARSMNAAWARFAFTGDPNGEGLPEWAPYHSDTRSVMELGDTCKLLADPQAEERTWWDGRL